MQLNEKSAKADETPTRPDSTGKTYQDLVESLFMGTAEDEEDAEDAE